MMLAIRIAGQINMPPSPKEMLFRLRLRQKYTAVLLPDNEESKHTLISLRSFVAYGPIDNETLVELLKARGFKYDKSGKLVKVSESEALKLSTELKTKTMKDLSLKPFFRLHPPRGGIDAKKHIGVTKQAVLGDNGKELVNLVRRML